MNKQRLHKGFSLTEVLMAVGVLAVGMVFIAGVFPVGLYFSTIATERTIAATVAEEAFAKIQLYGINLTDPFIWPIDTACADFNDVWKEAPEEFHIEEYAWPSDNEPIKGKQYFWSALCRPAGSDLVQVTVFVSRKIGAAKYRDPDVPLDSRIWWPYPRPVNVDVTKLNNYVIEMDEFNENILLSDGHTIINDNDGGIYRVMEKTVDSRNRRAYLRLDRKWEGGAKIWVVPFPIGGGRNPMIAVYQKTIRF